MSGRLAVVGAGPAGALLATYLARQGHEVALYESRPDLRTTDIDRKLQVAGLLAG